jgi:hypothetical protein
MVDYYKILGISTKATAREIKSAYRRLARKMHPDVNGGTEKAARDFDLLSKAYQTLSDPQERAYYDKQLLQGWNGSGDIYVTNPHARRLRRLAIQARMNRAIDRMFEEERRETFALQQAVYPTVTLFLSTFFAGMLKPSFWHSSGNLGKAILLVLFLVGVWHLIKRFRLCFERYTHQPSAIHDSIIDDKEEDEKPFTPLSALAYLAIGIAVSFGIGIFINLYLQDTILAAMPRFFDQATRAELMFYPPIAVLIVDSMHSIAAKLDG